MACDCDCQMLNTIKVMIRRIQKLEMELSQIKSDNFINSMANRDMHYEEECDCGCNSKK